MIAEFEMDGGIQHRVEIEYDYTTWGGEIDLTIRTGLLLAYGRRREFDPDKSHWASFWEKEIIKAIEIDSAERAYSGRDYMGNW